MAAVPAARPTRTPVQRLLAVGATLDLDVLRAAGAAMIGFGLLLPHLPGHPGLACPLRATTGVPCPFCGLSTSVEAAVRLDPRAAVTANPFGVVAVALALTLLLRPRWRRAHIPAVLLVLVVGVSWLFELHRFRVV